MSLVPEDFVARIDQLNDQELLQLIKHHPQSLSLREWSRVSGIQISRLFRIKEGKEMKLNEFLILKKTVKNYFQSKSDAFNQKTPDHFSVYETKKASVSHTDPLTNLCQQLKNILPINEFKNILLGLEYELQQYKSFSALE